MNKLKLTVGILLIFSTGIAAGHLGTVFHFKNKIFKQGPPALHHLIENKISRELQLTQQQKIKIDKIIVQAKENFDIFRQKHHPELKQNLNECFKKINEILTPEQQKKFKHIQNRFERGFRGPKGFSPRQGFGKPALFPIDKLAEDLYLNNDQINNIKPIIKQFNQDIKNIFEKDLAHKMDHDRGMHNRQDAGLKMKKIKNDMMVAVKPFLSEKQFLQLQEIMINQRLHQPQSE